ncbi:MAG: hypothetical protein ACK4GO_06185 [Gemmobacter sp.]
MNGQRDTTNTKDLFGDAMKIIFFSIFLILNVLLATEGNAQEVKTVPHSSGGSIDTGPDGYLRNTFKAAKPSFFQEILELARSGTQFIAKRAGWLGLAIEALSHANEHYPFDQLAGDALETLEDGAEITGNFVLDVVESAAIVVLFVGFMAWDLATGNW